PNGSPEKLLAQRPLAGGRGASSLPPPRPPGPVRSPHTKQLRPQVCSRLTALVKPVRPHHSFRDQIIADLLAESSPLLARSPAPAGHPSGTARGRVHHHARPPRPGARREWPSRLADREVYALTMAPRSAPPRTIQAELRRVR